jgi:hypothetical protein
MQGLKTAGAALALLLAGAPAVAAAQSNADIVREARDRAEIEGLMWRYARAIDTWNADAYVAVFTEDGSFGNVKGRAALHKMVEDFTKPRPPAPGAPAPAPGSPPAKPPVLHHMEGNQYIEFTDRDHALVHYYWITVSGAGPQPPLPQVLAVGNGLDHVVRVNGKWLIQSREVTAKE